MMMVVGISPLDKKNMLQEQAAHSAEVIITFNHCGPVNKLCRRLAPPGLIYPPLFPGKNLIH